MICAGFGPVIRFQLEVCWSLRLYRDPKLPHGQEKRRRTELSIKAWRVVIRNRPRNRSSSDKTDWSAMWPGML
jgi:hypothetical protein